MFLAICVVLAIANIESVHSTDLQSRLAGGKAEICPHLAVIQLPSNDSKSIAFGFGTIISSYSILTTKQLANVTKTVNGSSVFVGRTEVTSGGKEVKVKDFIFHDTIDIAILRIEEISFTGDVKAVKPVPSADMSQSQDVVLCGCSAGNFEHRPSGGVIKLLNGGVIKPGVITL